MKNKRGNVALIVIIIVIVAITTGAVGWMFAKRTQAPTQQVVPSVGQQNDKQSTAESNQNKSQEVVYNDRVYGFSLNFPQSWKGFKMTNNQEGTTGFRITFTHPTADCSFLVLLSTTKEWEDCKSQKNPNAFYWCGKELGRNDKYVFYPADNAPDCENANLVKEANEIIKTFKITNNKVTNLQTYANDEYGFSLSYPGNYKIKEANYKQEPQPGGTIYVVQLGDETVADFDADFDKGIMVYVAKIEKGMRNGTDPLAEPNGMDPVSQKDTIIDGQKARIYNNGEVYSVAKNGYEYLMILGGETNQSTKDNFAKIATSFKFTK